MAETKKKKPHNKVTFKSYEQHQGMLFLPSFEELIPSEHLVRLVSRAIDGMAQETLLNAYEGGGASNYHPKMLLKVLVYGYTDRLYSSRRLEKATRENINYMWLTGMQTPDHNTINRFRKGQLKETIKDVFAAVLLLLVEEGMVCLEDYHIDGTKIESAANRYTFVWAKTVSGHKERLPKDKSLNRKMNQLKAWAPGENTPARRWVWEDGGVMEDGARRKMNCVGFGSGWNPIYVLKCISIHFVFTLMLFNPFTRYHYFLFCKIAIF